MESLTSHSDYYDFVCFLHQSVEKNHWDGGYDWFCEVLDLKPADQASATKWHNWVRLAESLCWLSPSELTRLTLGSVKNEQRKPTATTGGDSSDPIRAFVARKTKQLRQGSHGGLPFGNDPL